eukprot:12918532-Prorocentrum_lima.AAC.1
MQASRNGPGSKVKKRAARRSASDEDDTRVSTMRLPNYRSGTNDRNVIVENISLSAPDGTELLDGGELRLAAGR